MSISSLHDQEGMLVLDHGVKLALESPKIQFSEPRTPQYTYRNNHDKESKFWPKISPKKIGRKMSPLRGLVDFVIYQFTLPPRRSRKFTTRRGIHSVLSYLEVVLKMKQTWVK